MDVQSKKVYESSSTSMRTAISNAGQTPVTQGSGQKNSSEQNFESVDVNANPPTLTRPVGYQFQHKKNYYATGQFVQPSFGAFNGFNVGANYQNPVSSQHYTQTSQAINMNVIVVTKEEIEAPWRSECEYLQSIIQELESNSKVEVVKEYVENTEKITILETERNSLKDLIQQLRGENKQLRDQLDGKSREVESRNREIELLRQKLSDAETRYNSLQSEYTLLRSQLDSDQRTLRQQLDSAISEIQRLKGQIDGDSIRYMNEINTRDSEIQKLRRENEEKNRALQQSQQRISELERERQMLQAEVDRLGSQLRERQQDIQGLKIEIDRLSSQLSDNTKVNTLQFTNQTLLSEINDMQDQLRSRLQDNDSLRSQMRDQEDEFNRRVQDYQFRIRDLEATIRNQQIEIDRLSLGLNQKNDEIQQWVIRYADLEAQGVTVIQEKVTYLTQEVEVWKERFIKVNHDYNKTQEDLIMAQAELESMRKGMKKEVVVSTRTVRTHNTNTSTTRGSGIMGTTGQVGPSITYTTSGSGVTSQAGDFGRKSQSPQNSQFLTPAYRPSQPHLP